MTSMPEWLRADFSAKRVANGYLVMDGDVPVAPFPHSSLASANSVVRDCQERRDGKRRRYES